MIGVDLMNNGVLFNEVLNTVMRGLVIPIIPVITTYLVSVINKYTEEINSKLDNDLFIKYTEIAEASIVTAIYAVYQLYIDDILKKNNRLTPDEANTAFNMIKEKSRNLIGHTVARELEYKYKDLDTWLENKISFILNSGTMNSYSISDELEVML